MKTLNTIVVTVPIYYFTKGLITLYSRKIVEMKNYNFFYSKLLFKAFGEMLIFTKS